MGPGSGPMGPQESSGLAEAREAQPRCPLGVGWGEVGLGTAARLGRVRGAATTMDAAPAEARSCRKAVGLPFVLSLPHAALGTYSPCGVLLADLNFRRNQLPGSRPWRQDFWALREVSWEVLGSLRGPLRRGQRASGLGEGRQGQTRIITPPPRRLSPPRLRAAASTGQIAVVTDSELGAGGSCWRWW